MLTQQEISNVIKEIQFFTEENSKIYLENFPDDIKKYIVSLLSPHIEFIDSLDIAAPKDKTYVFWYLDKNFKENTDFKNARGYCIVPILVGTNREDLPEFARDIVPIYFDEKEFASESAYSLRLCMSILCILCSELNIQEFQAIILVALLKQFPEYKIYDIYSLQDKFIPLNHNNDLIDEDDEDIQRISFKIFSKYPTSLLLNSFLQLKNTENSKRAAVKCLKLFETYQLTSIADLAKTIKENLCKVRTSEEAKSLIEKVTKLLRHSYDEISVDFESARKYLAHSVYFSIVSDAFPSKITFSDALYFAAVAVSVQFPINPIDPITQAEFTPADFKDTFYTSDRFRFNIQTLVDLFASKGKFENPFTRQPFAKKDIQIFNLIKEKLNLKSNLSQDENTYQANLGGILVSLNPILLQFLIDYDPERNHREVSSNDRLSDEQQENDYVFIDDENPQEITTTTREVDGRQILSNLRQSLYNLGRIDSVFHVDRQLRLQFEGELKGEPTLTSFIASTSRAAAFFQPFGQLSSSESPLPPEIDDLNLALERNPRLGR